MISKECDSGVSVNSRVDLVAIVIFPNAGKKCSPVIWELFAAVPQFGFAGIVVVHIDDMG